ncbi:hypothetical protein G7051_05925 [Dysgonomonas sp. HDW5B]|uniref:hypothetical protein n=1 Tax=Dysgonomonas sp. HDW5B TaxID=2714927 RepID=UPI0014095096|nr:hypothetical protein [Dysgonomonas sp. HDW5B]QIK53901.1 hypothetical protein G7051_05925 [Dysgonomonas sp. HDW5B]
MNQKNNNFTHLIEHACAALPLSHLAVKEKYNNYPVCLIRYMEKGNLLDCVEVSFDKENASLTFIMDKEDKCYSASIHFYDPKDETLFIIFMRQFSKYYSYRKKCWILKDSIYCKIEENEGTHFYFYKFVDADKYNN